MPPCQNRGCRFTAGDAFHYFNGMSWTCPVFLSARRAKTSGEIESVTGWLLRNQFRALACPPFNWRTKPPVRVPWQLTHSLRCRTQADSVSASHVHNVPRVLSATPMADTLAMGITPVSPCLFELNRNGRCLFQRILFSIVQHFAVRAKNHPRTAPGLPYRNRTACPARHTTDYQQKRFRKLWKIGNPVRSEKILFCIG